MTADSEGRSCGTGGQSVLGNNKNNKNPFLLPRAGTTTFPSLKIKPSSQVTKWGARSERVDQKNKRTNTPSPSLSLSLSLHYNFNRAELPFFLRCINRHTASAQPIVSHLAHSLRAALSSLAHSPLAHSFFGTQPLFVQLCILISSATVGLSRPAAAVAVPGPELLRIALIDRPSHACTDMAHYIQVRCVSQARNAFRCNGQVQTQRHGQKHTKRTALPKGEGALPHNLSPALVEPPSVAEVLPSFAHAFAHAGLLPQLVALAASPSSW